MQVAWVFLPMMPTVTAVDICEPSVSKKLGSEVHKNQDQEDDDNNEEEHEDTDEG